MLAPVCCTHCWTQVSRVRGAVSVRNSILAGQPLGTPQQNASSAQGASLQEGARPPAPTRRPQTTATAPVARFRAAAGLCAPAVRRRTARCAYVTAFTGEGRCACMSYPVCSDPPPGLLSVRLWAWVTDTAELLIATGRAYSAVSIMQSPSYACCPSDALSLRCQATMSRRNPRLYISFEKWMCCGHLTMVALCLTSADGLSLCKATPTLRTSHRRNAGELNGASHRQDLLKSGFARCCTPARMYHKPT